MNYLASLTFIAVYFQANHAGHLKYSQENEVFLQELMDSQQKAYSAVTSVRFEGLENVPVVIGIGAFDQAFGLEEYKQKSESEDPIILIGSKVKKIKVGDRLQYGIIKKNQYAVEGKLPPNSTYILREAISSLDESILILTSKHQMNELHSYYYIDELIRNSVLLRSGPEEIADYILRMHKNGTTLSPISFNEQLNGHYGTLYRNAILLTAFYLITAIFVFISLTINVIQLVQQNLREYAVHLLYGANLTAVFKRILTYLLFIIVPPVSFALYLLYFMGAGAAYIYWGLAVCILASFSIGLVGSARLKSSEIINIARESS